MEKSQSKARIIRDGVVVFNGEIQSIYREKSSEEVEPDLNVE